MAGKTRICTSVDPKTLRIADRMARRLEMSRSEYFGYTFRWYFAPLKHGCASPISVEALLSESEK